jgi:hypothetical protein
MLPRRNRSEGISLCYELVFCCGILRVPAPVPTISVIALNYGTRLHNNFDDLFHARDKGGFGEVTAAFGAQDEPTNAERNSIPAWLNDVCAVSWSIREGKFQNEIARFRTSMAQNLATLD